MKRLALLILFVLSFTINSTAQYYSSDWEERDEWMDVERIFRITGIDEGDHVADIGCHEGYFSMHLARKVGMRGKVYAVDVRQDRLEKLNGNAADRKLYNITTIHGDYDNPKLPENELDLVVIMDTYHEMKDYMTILEHVKRSLKPSGKILIIEKLKSHSKDKDRAGQTAAHTLAPHFVKKELQEAGFKVIDQVNNMGNWENDNSKRIWALLAVSPDA